MRKEEEVRMRKNERQNYIDTHAETRIKTNPKGTKYGSKKRRKRKDIKNVCDEKRPSVRRR